MKATAMAHPIQGLVKYHGMRDHVERLPYHDSISVCTAPSHTRTTVEFSMDYDEDTFVVDGEELGGRAAERVEAVVEKARSLSDAAHTVYPVRLESENSFPTNVGLGSSSSGFAAAAMALAEAAELDASMQEISTIARVGSASSARAVTGAFSQLQTGLNDEDCVSRRLPTDLHENLKIIVGLVPYHKETEDAHNEAEDSHMFEARNAHIHSQIAEMRDALRENDFHRTFELAEHDSLSLAATTMTGPEGWVYWQPATLAIFNRVRELREEEEIPVYFSTDTGATVYVNTTDEHAEYVEEQISDCGVSTSIWEVGGPAKLLDEDEHLF
ncbi:phosphomevalonate decarboxylase MvaD [Natronobacterium gregoryi]|uniref:Diphosphomevalonate decarboxylase n=2 Tax=Natronobacterium gregoryi TaxID=44930 RepID=L0ACZ5_NATGS|nr:phosphomevalonate decarboxylase MvaD [Natronobacterium gregoryi]AFZ71711.1 mevalonate pyrophosphate decarboxylase [Natronobacterium gregoryi SP2]ELY72717.1 diphosphomevalonate decarboxylase [Natronobacterium gregoryi SP2]PLK20241.1 diphosphomevalonate decarboxylase [Natronobacterium gregoryi SP2]SFJ26358.1 diphosphomevalonate decarboxylase [Natronobacterium gregoryi]